MHGTCSIHLLTVYQVLWTALETSLRKCQQPRLALDPPLMGHRSLGLSGQHQSCAKASCWANDTETPSTGRFHLQGQLLLTSVSDCRAAAVNFQVPGVVVLKFGRPLTHRVPISQHVLDTQLPRPLLPPPHRRSPTRCGGPLDP